MEINQDLIMQFGLMQKLSTGNSILDALLVLLLPLLFNRILPYLQDLLERCKRPKTSSYTRNIAFTYRPGQYFDYDGEVPPNHKLQAAILVYLNSLPGVREKLVAADVELVKGQKTNMTRTDDTRNEDASMDLFSSDSDSDSSDSDYYWYPGIELERFEVNMVPPMGEVITIEPGLTFCRIQNTTESSDKKSETSMVTFTLESESAQQIDAFISAAYDSYRAALRGKRQTWEEERYLYLPVLSGAEGRKEDDFTFRRYKLSDDKDFTNFFHPEKEAIINLVESFGNKTGKFGIKGYPQKLGFLLHGPPGTGKTTFIKALATHTKRSIINIPLSRISTNQQLMSLMMEQRVKVEGDDTTIPLPHDKVIYVCEDVDAASHVVRKRTSPDAVAAAFASLIEKQAAAVSSKKEEQKAEEESDGSDAKASKDTPIGPAPAPAGAVFAAGLMRRGLGPGFGSGDDELNLAGLLNVLDGVVDTPGRLLVLSTNHPEQLDPALVRPGRINRKIYLGHISAPEALQMIAHYFGDLQPEQESALVARWRDGVMSPAALEALCAECDDVESLMQAVDVLISLSDASATMLDQAEGPDNQAEDAASQSGSPDSPEEGLHNEGCDAGESSGCSSNRSSSSGHSSCTPSPAAEVQQQTTSSSTASSPTPFAAAASAAKETAPSCRSCGRVVMLRASSCVASFAANCGS